MGDVSDNKKRWKLGSGDGAFWKGGGRSYPKTGGGEELDGKVFKWGQIAEIVGITKVPKESVSKRREAGGVEKNRGEPKNIPGRKRGTGEFVLVRGARKS